jgi:hypothetical protein
MANRSKKIWIVLRSLFVLSILIFSSVQVPAQTTEPGSSSSDESDVKKKNSKLDISTAMGFEYLDNVFTLTPQQIWRQKQNDDSDRAAGRFKDMESVSDIIARPVIGLKYAAKSPMGGKLNLSSSVVYNYYTKNRKAGFPEMQIKAKNSIGKNGELSFQGDYISGFFKKNYLSGFDDTNSNGNITREERIYSGATYDEYQLTLSYSHNVIKDKDKKISQLDVRPFIGIEKRTFNQVFSNRDRSITFAGLDSSLGFGSDIGLKLLYKYEKVSSPNKTELVLFDETTSGTDVNSDGNIKANAPLFTEIDRSSTRNTIEIEPSFRLTRNIDLSLGYERRTTAYQSDNVLDVDHYNTTAVRQTLKSGIDLKISKKWSTGFDYSRIKDDDEDGNYLQNHFIVTLKYNII